MKIYAITVIKNEEDIIGFTLSNASKWADKVIVFDNGSTDSTWEKVNDMPFSNVIPFKQDDKPYSDGLRADIFNEFKSEMNDGDWWFIQDGDEIFYDNPLQFLDRNKSYYHHINGKKIDFSFDLNLIGEIDFEKEFSDNYDLFNFYNPEAWSEPRAIMHRTGLSWDEQGIWPSPMGLVCSEPIRIQHFPLRSPKQMKDRWKTRMESLEKGGQFFKHWEKNSWDDYYQKKMGEQKRNMNFEETFKSVPLKNSFKQPLSKRALKFFLHKTGILP